MGSMTRVLISQTCIDLLGPRFEALPVTPVVAGGWAEGVEVAWASSDVFRDPKLTRKVLGAAKASDELKWLHTSAAGVDSPIFRELADRGVVLTTSHVTGPTIAEYTMRAVLDWYQKPELWQQAQRERRWQEHEFREVLGTTWLIVGLGSIGREVAVRAKAFGATVIGTRRTPSGDEPVDEMLTPDRTAEVLPRADVVVLAAPATAATSGLVDEAFLAAMKPGSVLVNIARGPLVDEAALLRALDAGSLDGALLDVTNDEPLPADSPLWSHPGVALTPHSSGLGSGRLARSGEIFLENLTKFLAGEPMRNVVTDAELIG
jgi:phosphoglycerate dehydrogenase-like enzyme